MQPMFTNLHRHVLDRLAAREVPWTQVARDTGMSYETLKKIASGRTPNPGVRHVQKLADYFGTGLLAVQQAVANEQMAETAHADMTPAADALPDCNLPPWDGITERRKLNAPVDRRVSPESVARAAFLRSQRGG